MGFKKNLVGEKLQNRPSTYFLVMTGEFKGILNISQKLYSLLYINPLEQDTQTTTTTTTPTDQLTKKNENRRRPVRDPLVDVNKQQLRTSVSTHG